MTGSFSFTTRVFYFEPLKKQVAIVVQNENGPCMLIAIVNTLILTNRVVLPSGTYSPMQLVDIIMGVCPEVGDISFLVEGCDIIPHFSSCDKFTDKPAFLDELGIKMYHSMIPNPMNPHFAFISDHDYNELQVRLADLKSDLVTDANEINMIEEWLDVIKGQVTKLGLEVIQSGMNEGESVIYFRANHFSVLYKHNSRVFALLTDDGFLHTPCIWETLPDEKGESKYFDETFFPVQLEPDIIPTNLLEQNNRRPINNRPTDPYTRPSANSTRQNSNHPINPYQPSYSVQTPRRTANQQVQRTNNNLQQRNAQTPNRGRNQQSNDALGSDCCNLI